MSAGVAHEKNMRWEWAWRRLPASRPQGSPVNGPKRKRVPAAAATTKQATAPDHTLIRRASSIRSEEHTSELQSRENLVCRLLLEKKKKKKNRHNSIYTPLSDIIII